MLKRFASTGAILFFSILVLIALIGLVTFIAWRVINRTVLEQSRTAELQLVTSLSQQTQANMNNLEAQINNLAVQDDIRATSSTRFDEALALLEREGNRSELDNSDPDAPPLFYIKSITRFDFRGTPIYAWPPELNEQVQADDDPAAYIYQVPKDLLDQTSRGQAAVSSIETGVRRVPRQGARQQAVVLIAPVNAVNLRTGYLVYELDLELFFQDLYSFVDLGDSGQLWVLDTIGDVRYQARPNLSIQSTNEAYSHSRLRNQRDPLIDTYSANGETRQAAIAAFPALGETFVIFISRLESEAQAGVTQNVISIFAGSVAAMFLVVGAGSLGAYQLRRTNLEKQQESQRRQTARILLEVSRALNSSLDLTTVLDRILEELGRLVPHDSASIMLLEGENLRVSAARGADDTVGTVFGMNQARAAREVLSNGYPSVINDTDSDERWARISETQQIASWIGLPLRVREKYVGVLNINSYERNRFQTDDIELSEGFADQASVAIQNAQFHELQLKQYEQELVIARGIQTSLLPQAAPNVANLEFASYALPASQVSGDFFQYIPMVDGRVGIAIGDVQGKGIPAALMMAVITTAMRDEATRYQKPALLLQALNKRLIDRMKQNRINSALMVAVYDPRSREIEIANGGMVQPYLRSNGGNFDFVQIGGYPLGMSDSIQYNSKAVQFQMGSTMVLVSDGVVEAQSPDGEFFGFDRLEELLNTVPRDMAAENILGNILAAVQTHLAGQAPQDDTTIIVLRAMEVAAAADPSLLDTQPIRIPQQVEAAAQPITETVTLSVDDKSVEARVSLLPDEDYHLNIELQLPSRLGYEKVARGTVEALAWELGFSSDRIEDMKTAISEACMNAIEHGNGEDLGQSVKVWINVWKQGIEMRVIDRGYKNLPPELPPPGKGDMRGWGLFFIQHLMDIFEIRHLPDGGNMVRLVMYLHPEEVDIASDGNLADNKFKS